MMHLNARIRFCFREHSKNVQKSEGKDEFYAAINDSNAIKGSPEGTRERAPNYALSNLHEDAQEGAFEVALKGALEVAQGCTCSCTF